MSITQPKCIDINPWNVLVVNNNGPEFILVVCGNQEHF